MIQKNIDGQTVYLISDKQEWEIIFSSGYFLGKSLELLNSTLEKQKDNLNNLKKGIFVSIDKKLTNIHHGLALPYNIPPYPERFWVYHFFQVNEIYYRVESIYPKCPNCQWIGYALTKYASDSIYGFTQEYRFEAIKRNQSLKIVNCPCCDTPFDSRAGIVFTDSCENRFT